MGLLGIGRDRDRRPDSPCLDRRVLLQSSLDGQLYDLIPRLIEARGFDIKNDDGCVSVRHQSLDSPTQDTPSPQISQNGVPTAIGITLPPGKLACFFHQLALGCRSHLTTQAPEVLSAASARASTHISTRTAQGPEITLSLADRMCPGDDMSLSTLSFIRATRTSCIVTATIASMGDDMME